MSPSRGCDSALATASTAAARARSPAVPSAAAFTMPCSRSTLGRPWASARASAAVTVGAKPVVIEMMATVAAASAALRWANIPARSQLRRAAPAAATSVSTPAGTWGRSTASTRARRAGVTVPAAKVIASPEAPNAVDRSARALPGSSSPAMNSCSWSLTDSSPTRPAARSAERSAVLTTPSRTELLAARAKPTVTSRPTMNSKPVSTPPEVSAFRCTAAAVARLPAVRCSRRTASWPGVCDVGVMGARAADGTGVGVRARSRSRSRRSRDILSMVALPAGGEKPGSRITAIRVPGSHRVHASWVCCRSSSAPWRSSPTPARSVRWCAASA